MESYNVNFIGEKKNVRYSQGSGVVFKKEIGEGDKNTYYLLTNNHVVYKRENLYSKFDYLVQDCYGNIVDAIVVASNPNHDLAVMKFKSEKEYTVLPFASEDPEINDTIISIGGPLGVINAVTIGKIESYVNVVFEDDNGVKDTNISNVTYKVLKHTSYINNGSSGGALINRNYELCGINYAAGVGAENPVCGYAIQISKVKEFLNENFAQG
jgi:S1-C subfamily serine protease